jgi:hypothetical protein
MIGMPFHSEAAAGVWVGGKEVFVGAGMAVRVGTTVTIAVGTGVDVNGAELEQAVRRTSKITHTTMFFSTRPSFVR